MDSIRSSINSRPKWRFTLTILLLLATNSNGDSRNDTNESIDTKLNSNQCHSCHSSKNDSDVNKYIDRVVKTFNSYSEDNLNFNKTLDYLEKNVEVLLDEAMSKDIYEVMDGIVMELNKNSNIKDGKDSEEGRALFSKYTYEYRLYQKVKNFMNNNILSINLPMAAKSFGLNKLFIPLLIGGQILIKSVLFAMFLPSILGSVGKMLSRGLSHVSAASSQASYPPAMGDDANGYNSDIMGYESNQAGTFAYPQDGYENEVNEPGNVDMSRFGADAQKAGYLPSKNSYYKIQMASPNNYKVFQKIPASSMILSNYDPFYSPLLSRLDGIFSRLGLAPSENAVDENVEPCREQLICLMYASPAKFAPYSNLVSAQLSRELNELRRPVSDNPEILRFFKYMKAARRGQEGSDCMYSYPTCNAHAPKTHTMIAAYQDINKLVSARKRH